LAFRGQYEHSLDSKDRLTIPARFRGVLADGVVLFEELDPCVSIYSPQEYDRLTARYVGSLSPLSREGRMMKRRFHARSHDEALDSAGRVRLPKHLVDHAGLSGACVIVGVQDHLEIWNPERWSAEDAEIDSRAGEMAEGLSSGGGA
jgi:MraZ protein